MRITTSARGKLVLFGEHSVVYGHPAIVMAIDKRIFVTVEEVKEKGIVFETGGIDTRFIQSACAIFKSTSDVDLEGLRISTRSEFGNVSGLGSSAAVTVATIDALGQFFKIPLTKEKLFDLSFRAVQKVQKMGSGIDVAASVYGGILKYQKGVIPDLLALRSRIRDPGIYIDSPQGYFPFHGVARLRGNDRTNYLLICFSGVKANSVKLMNQVKKNPDKELIFQKMEGIVNQAESALQNNDWETAGKLMNENHTLLQELGVSTQFLDQLVATAVENGAYGAKLSGAGGGDCMIAIVSPEKRTDVEKALQKQG